MTKKWFGPVLCPSGCCYEPPPPPPPPPCACDDVECFPEDELNFSSVKFEVDLDDEWTSLGYYKSLRCAANCRNTYQVTEHERTYSGFSAFNGTYDIPYYVYDDYTEEWIEGDPLAIPCGVWFYPTIAATITGTYTQRQYAGPADIYSVYDESACIQSTTTLTETRTFYLETRSGLIWPASDTITRVFAWNTHDSSAPSKDFYGPISAGLWPGLSPAVLQRQIDGSVFACSTYGESAIDETFNVDGTQPYYGSPLRHLPPIPGGVGNVYADFRAVGVGYDPAKTQFAEPRRSSGYPWADYPYGGPGIPVSSTQCKLDVEEYEDQISATSTDRVSLDGANFRCNPIFPTNTIVSGGSLYKDIWHFENTAFRQYFRSIVNAP